MSFSDYIVYVDESGDHGLESVDQHYPVFVLAFCIFNKEAYAESVAPAIQRFKFRHFGHDMVILHETDIRKDRGDFQHLKSKELKEAFLCDLSDILADAQFTLVCSVIEKLPLKQRYDDPHNPYHIALRFGLERVYEYLKKLEQFESLTHVIAEKRGDREDRELELEFRRIVDGDNYRSQQLPFKIVFADKKSNSCGLQLADLVARPVGLSVLRPDQTNRAYEVVKGKFDRDDKGKFEGWGLKRFP